MDARHDRSAPSPAGLALLRAMRSRNYRLFFIGQSISLTGTWLTRIATSWLVYRLTNSALLLGAVAFAGQIPTFLFAPLGGVLVDRLDRHRILLITQTLAMVQSFLLAYLALTETIGVWQILVLNAFQGGINALDTPARQAFVVEMVEDRADLPNAIALNSVMVNGARLFGPSVAGLLIATVGEGGCFLLDGFSYLAVIGSLAAMTLRPRGSASRKGQILEGVKEGFAYAFGFAPVRAIILLLGLVSLMGMPYTVLLPVFARDILQGGPTELGFLAAAPGVGALVGGVYLASRRTVLGLGRIIAIAGIIFSVALVAFSMSRVFWLSLLLLLVAGFGMIAQTAASNTILQTIVEEDKRGRVSSVYTMAFMGMVPFGSLLAGGLAGEIGPAHTLLLGGGCCLLGSALFATRLRALRRMVRPIYVRMGIIPEAVAAIQDSIQ